MSRPEHDRAIYPILVDEFHVYASQGMDTEIIETFLGETRSFQVPLVVSTQFLGRLTRNVVLALLGNLGTQICMRMGQVDAQVLHYCRTKEEAERIVSGIVDEHGTE